MTYLNHCDSLMRSLKVTFIFTLCFSLAEPRWASVNRGVLICDECCSVHRSLGRHSSQVRHLTHTPWPPTQLQVITSYWIMLDLYSPMLLGFKLSSVKYFLVNAQTEWSTLKCFEVMSSLHTMYITVVLNLAGLYLGSKCIDFV